MHKTLIVIAMTFGMNVSVAFAQHENMPGHENMAPGDHAKHNKKKEKEKKKTDGDTDKQEAPKTDAQKHKGHDTP